MSYTPQDGDLMRTNTGGMDRDYLVKNIRMDGGRNLCSLMDEDGTRGSGNQTYPMEYFQEKYMKWTLVRSSGPLKDYTVVDCVNGCGKFVIAPGNKWIDKCENCR